jgi:hypothetical protein
MRFSAKSAVEGRSRRSARLVAFSVAACAAAQAGAGVDAAVLAAFQEPAACGRAASRAGLSGVFIGQFPTVWLDATAVNCGHADSSASSQLSGSTQPP